MIRKRRLDTLDEFADAAEDDDAAPAPARPRTEDDGGEDGEDELEAFMRANEAEVKRAPAPAPSGQRGVRDDIEEEDELEKYVNLMKAKGVELGAATADAPATDGRDDVDSDEEVYAAARAADAHAASNEPTRVRQDVEPLAPVDHTLNDYIELNKVFYEEPAEIAAMSAEEVGQLRRKLDMRVYGPNVPRPCLTFRQFGFDEALLKVIAVHGYTEPTPIQKQAIPVALSGRDIIGVAKTGSGKTAAYLLPMIVHIMDQPELDDGDGPIGLVLAPTRELCVQIHQEAKKFAKAYSLRVACIYGGVPKMEQRKELKALPEIVVATPGRFIDMVKMRATNFRRASFCVLDEADRMFDLGFEPQVRSIVNSIRPDRQTLMFSATFNRRVERLCDDMLNMSVRINIGNVGEANTDITQIAIVLDADAQKWPWLLHKLPGLMIDGQIIIFVSRIGQVDELAKNLRANDYECGTLHGEMQQHERDRVMRDFKKGKLLVLIATDVAARGLDIPEVRTVINYDTARDIDSHVHRIGRTGRAGQKGSAFTIVTPRDDRFAGDLVRNFENAGQYVPPELLELAMRHPQFHARRAGLLQHGRHGGRRGGGGRGRGRWTGREGLGLGAAASGTLPSASAPGAAPVRFTPSVDSYATVAAGESASEPTKRTF